MDTSSWTAFGVSLFGTPKPAVDFLASINWIAVSIAFLTPVLLLYARREIRIRRLRGILDFMTSFKIYGKAPTDSPADGLELYNPSFEFVKSKYISDIKLQPNESSAIAALPNEEDRIRRYIELAGETFGRSNNRIYLSALAS